MSCPKQEQDRILAEKFSCSTRTVRRWRQRGVNLESDLSIVDCIVSNRSSTNSQLAACKSILDRIQSQETNKQ